MPCTRASAQLGTCTAGWASPRNCLTASMIFVIPPRLAGWLLHRPPPSVLKGSFPIPEIKFPSSTKRPPRSEEHTSELQSLMRISYAVFCLKKKKQHHTYNIKQHKL